MSEDTFAVQGKAFATLLFPNNPIVVRAFIAKQTFF